MSRICACCFCWALALLRLLSQRSRECSSTPRYIWTRRSYRADHFRHCGGRHSVQHHSPHQQDDVDKTRFTSPAMGNHETVKYLVVVGDYGYSYSRVSNTSTGKGSGGFVAAPATWGSVLEPTHPYKKTKFHNLWKTWQAR